LKDRKAGGFERQAKENRNGDKREDGSAMFSQVLREQGQERPNRGLTRREHGERRRQETDASGIGKSHKADNPARGTRFYRMDPNGATRKGKAEVNKPGREP